MSHKYVWWATEHMAKICQSYKQQNLTAFNNMEGSLVLLADGSTQPNYLTYVPTDTQK